MFLPRYLKSPGSYAEQVFASGADKNLFYAIPRAFQVPKEETCKWELWKRNGLSKA
jgi:hypothetical protein